MPKGFAIPAQDLLQKNVENTTDFSLLPWCQEIIADSAFKPIAIRSPLQDGDSNRSLFARTLWTSDTIRSCLAFYSGAIAETGTLPKGVSSDPVQLGETRIIVSLGTGVNGIVGVAHGGLVAFLLDEVTGVPVYVGIPGYFLTAEMKVTYRRPVATPAVVLCRSWVEERGVVDGGRKVRVKGTVEDGRGEVLARGETLFVRLKERL